MMVWGYLGAWIWLTRIWIVQDKTVLMFAIEAKLEALCIKMVEKGADVNAKLVSSICSPSIHVSLSYVKRVLT